MIPKAMPIERVQLLLDTLLSTIILLYVPYTEIDFQAYMQQVSKIKSGERVYSQVSGSTGPLVYPAGFVWFFLAINQVTGASIRPAQIIFTLLYLCNTCLIVMLHKHCKFTPPTMLPLLSLSKRLHSIYILRLFNDGVVSLLNNACIAVAAYHSCCNKARYFIGASVVLSLAVTVKMNALLFLPPLAVIMLRVSSIRCILLSAVSFLTVQLLLALPFLVHAPSAYIARAFDLQRAFLYEWSVNWQFIPVEVFHSASFSRMLLFLHMLLLLLFAHFKWCSDLPYGFPGTYLFFSFLLLLHLVFPLLHKFATVFIAIATIHLHHDVPPQIVVVSFSRHTATLIL